MIKEDRSFGAECLVALCGFYYGPPGEPALPVRLAQHMFDRLNKETRLHLSKDTLIQHMAACLVAKDRWGSTGNLAIAGNRVRVGTHADGEAFAEFGAGNTYGEAFADATERGH